ncbi:hypothetical protein HYDPIDRAFT_42622 [Hydnomerulius pinastri MD-312]|uniref:RING-type E3 ubiquitin transferase n=1 Tax=Hydnomerulius pinastri MD-312 TaxID=994086 RepID=A0A0C9WC57_9AGAM|nr:hypothetical protein HYDPIDRAFT_42622 [Hydnomerulius pinastri MD-312]
MPSCPQCPGRSFVDKNALRMHKETKHSRVWRCHPCNREFSSVQALEQHKEAKHTFECRYCYSRFGTPEGRLRHERDKHPTYECSYCDREFSSSEARQQHERDKHSGYECRYCDKEFNSGEARQQHEDVKHIRVFQRSRYARDTHSASHSIYTPLFSSSQAVQQPTVSNPVTYFPTLPASTSSTPTTDQGVTGRASTASTQSQREGDEAKQTLDVAESHAPGNESSSSSETSPLSEIDPSTAAREEESSICECTVCERAGQPCSCTICKRRLASPSTSAYGDIQPDDAQDDGQSTVSDGAEMQNCPADDLQVTYHCLSCSLVFDTDDDLQGHVCTSRRTIFRPHCSFCYTQFDSESSLEQHMDNSRLSFSCSLCQTPCCSDDMLQEHVLTHPTCLRCENSFIDDLDLCKHVELAHPVVVCWDCEGAVVDQGSLELHYADSPEHPSCSFCGVGMRNSEDMAEHLNAQHATESVLNEIEGSIDGHEQTAGGQVTSNDESASPEEPLPEDVRDGPADSDHFPPMLANEASPTNEEFHKPPSSPVSIEQSLSLTPPSTPTRSRHEGDTTSPSGTAHGDDPSEFASRRFASPSPTPSEHGSDGVRSRLHAQHSEPDITGLSETRPASPQASTLMESFYEFSAPSSPSSSGQSVVFISADGIPDYVRENRAYLVATSAASPSPGRSPILLPSSSSLESLELLQEPPNDTVQSVDSAGSTTSTVTYRHHCRICQRDPCEDMTATICGHIFCKKCVTQAVVAKSECPVCHSATLLYCLFKLDLSV